MKLDEFIADYNAMYMTSFSFRDSQQYENYFKDISMRIGGIKKRSCNFIGPQLNYELILLMIIGQHMIARMEVSYVCWNCP